MLFYPLESGSLISWSPGQKGQGFSQVFLYPFLVTHFLSSPVGPSQGTIGEKKTQETHPCYEFFYVLHLLPNLPAIVNFSLSSDGWFLYFTQNFSCNQQESQIVLRLLHLVCYWKSPLKSFFKLFIYTFNMHFILEKILENSLQILFLLVW